MKLKIIKLIQIILLIEMWNKARLKQVKLKDKWIKIRIRYSGQKLAVIYAVKTIYSLTV